MTEDVENCVIPSGSEDAGDHEQIVTSENACVKSGTCSEDAILAGILVNVKVNDSQDFDFYVLSDTGSELTLLMNENLGDNHAWYAGNDNNSHGPQTAVSELKSRTDNWKNVVEKEYIYSDDSGQNKYTAFSETMRARMLTNTEANQIKDANNGTMPRWMYINLQGTGSDTDSSGRVRDGYWTSTGYSGAPVFAWCITAFGIIDNYATSSTHGLRPVITISK